MEKTLTTLLLPETVRPGLDIASSTAVVIDVLRATSVMTAAGASGVRRIHTCETIASAETLASSLSERPLLCGERQCVPIEGFDLGNSPLSYTTECVRDREMILTTTNGTKAIKLVQSARRILVASLANLSTVVAQIASDDNVLLVCAGTHGEVSGEDVLLAGGIAEALGEHEAWSMDDASSLARLHWQQANDGAGVLAALRDSRGGRNLIALGYDADVEECSRLNHVQGWVERDSEADRMTSFTFRMP
ncbi:MAG: 2-phosphosulfolactate phosphatase [Planctomycetota bacterium]